MLTVNDFSTFKADLAIEIDRLITEALDLYENTNAFQNRIDEEVQSHLNTVRFEYGYSCTEPNSHLKLWLITDEVEMKASRAIDLEEMLLGDGVLDDHPQNLTWMISRLEHMIESLQNRLKEGRWERLYGKPPKPQA
jgi:hypothetical protein